LRGSEAINLPETRRDQRHFGATEITIGRGRQALQNTRTFCGKIVVGRKAIDAARSANGYLQQAAGERISAERLKKQHRDLALGGRALREDPTDHFEGGTMILERNIKEVTRYRGLLTGNLPTSNPKTLGRYRVTIEGKKPLDQIGARLWLGRRKSGQQGE